MNRYTKKECVEEFLFSVRRAMIFTKKTPGYNVPKQLEKYGAVLESMIAELGEFEEQLFRAQWAKEDETVE